MDSFLSLEEFPVPVLWFIQKHVCNSRRFLCVLLESDSCRFAVININININEVRESDMYLGGVASSLWCFFLPSALLLLALE